MLIGGQGHDVLKGGRGNDELRGGAGNDHLRGGPGDDVLRGGLGNDVLQGGGGDDLLRGWHGHDVLNGGAGDDLMTGGLGRDVFIFGGRSGDDRITDFADGIDMIRFTPAAARGMDDLDISARDGGVLITHEGGSIFINHADVADFSAADFIF